MKMKYCSISGLIEAVALDECLAQRLIGGRVDHHIDRVADGVDANEHDHRHRDDHQKRLQNALDKKTDHTYPCGLKDVSIKEQAGRALPGRLHVR